MITDGSRDGSSVACATVFPSNTIIYRRLPDSASIFTVEIKDLVTSKYIISDIFDKINVVE